MPSSKQRREAERRRLERQGQRRAQREVRRRRITLIASVVGALAVIGVVIGFVVANTGGNGGAAAASTPAPNTGAPSTSTSSSSAPVASYPCTWTPGGAAAKKVVAPATTTPPRSGRTRVAVETSQGRLTFELNRAAAPCAAASFVSLVQQHYFDSTPCHRLTTAGIYVLQCGDPTGSGNGGPGYSFRDELTGAEKYTRGVLAMANAGPNTNGSQFFIVYKNAVLQPNYTIFGTVVQGLDVVDKVAAAGASGGNDGKPKLPVELTKLTVTN